MKDDEGSKQRTIKQGQSNKDMDNQTRTMAMAMAMAALGEYNHERAIHLNKDKQTGYEYSARRSTNSEKEEKGESRC